MKRIDILIKKIEELGLKVPTKITKDSLANVLREYYWSKDFPGQEMIAQIEPMLAKNYKDLEISSDELFYSTEWFMEPKLNGVRQLAHFVVLKGKKTIKFTSRRISDKNYRFTEATNLNHLICEYPDELIGLVLDGEVKCPKHHVVTKGVETKDELQATTALLALKQKQSEEIQRSQNCFLEFTVFDILYTSSTKSCFKIPYALRRELLYSLFKKRILTPRFWHLIESNLSGKLKIFESIIESGGEGVMFKHCSGLYEPGKRSKYMLKMKRGLEVDAFVTGFVPPRHDSQYEKEGLIGGLVFSVIEEKTGEVVRVGTVSSFPLEDRRSFSLLVNGKISMNKKMLGKVAQIKGIDISPQNGLIQMCSMGRWRIGPDSKSREECVIDWEKMIKNYHSNRN